MADVPVLFDKPIPETQVSAPYKSYTHPVMGSILITAGFMEPAGHGFKSEPRKAIYVEARSVHARAKRPVRSGAPPKIEVPAEFPF